MTELLGRTRKLEQLTSALMYDASAAKLILNDLTTEVSHILRRLSEGETYIGSGHLNNKLAEFDRLAKELVNTIGEYNDAANLRLMEKGK